MLEENERAYTIIQEGISRRIRKHFTYLQENGDQTENLKKQSNILQEAIASIQNIWKYS